jgi:hypothetical protein
MARKSHNTPALIFVDGSEGFIRPDRSDKTLKFEIRSVREIVAKVVPHFRVYPLMSAKQADFERFARIAELVNGAKHLELQGLEEIVKLAMEMNPSGKRKYIGGEILGSLRSGERIVCATGNRGDHEVPTCTNGVTLATLSRPETQ